MTTNNIESELSYAYLHAIASRAGFGCQIAGRHDDNAGVDALIRVDEYLDPNSILFNFSFEVQLKSTVKAARQKSGHFPYYFSGVDRYNRLRRPGSPLPKILVVLFLPPDPEKWLTFSESGLTARKCAYWVSLKDAPASDNSSGQTIYLPAINCLSVNGLKDVARRLSLQEDLHYAA